MKFIIGLCLLCVGIVANAQTDKEFKELQKKHRDWDKGFCVLASGDTIKGKILPQAVTALDEWRYSPITYVFLGFYNNNSYKRVEKPCVVIANKNEREDTIELADVAEINVEALPDSIFRYILMPVDTTLELFHLMADGEAKLLSRETVRNLLKVIKPSNNSASVQIKHWYFGGVMDFYIKDEYLLYYKGQFTSIHPKALYPKKKDEEKIAPLLKAFADCPEIIKKINTPNYQEFYLENLVKEFNKCIAGK